MSKGKTYLWITNFFFSLANPTFELLMARRSKKLREAWGERSVWQPAAHFPLYLVLLNFLGRISKPSSTAHDLVLSFLRVT